MTSLAVVMARGVNMSRRVVSTGLRWCLVASFGVAMIGCNGEDDRVPSLFGEAGLPQPSDAGAATSDANVVVSSSLDASSANGSSAEMQSDSGVEGSGPAPAMSSGQTAEPGVPDAGNEALVRCAPARCTCPDPGSQNCCQEFIPYHKYTVLGDAGTAPSVETAEEQPATANQTRKRLWGAFESGCAGNGSCHVGVDLPWFHFQEASFEAFAEDLAQKCMDRVTSSDPVRAMPTGGGAGDGRKCDDEYVTLCRELEAYQKSGYADSFPVPVCPKEGQENEEPERPSPVGDCAIGSEPYRLPAQLAFSQTNIGQCIPTTLADECPTSALTAKDELFASLKGFGDLPSKLSETDLVSLDSEVLAGHRVYSYAPTYTLFSDNAKKQRYVRVPVGQAIRYNDAIQDFDIPDNTRFYKTFLKGVKHTDGSVSYRKMETRLIVVRQDAQNEDGSFTVRAIRATYAWDKEEREAHLVTDPLKNREPWSDRLCPVIVDESSPRDPDSNPIIASPHRECTYMTSEEEEDLASGSIRHYGIPGIQRCDECHMGANNHSYVLGFNPWQVDRRPLGEGGTYEPPHVDELDQLKRLIEYGVISGIEPGQAKLEESQGDRAPRNDFELTAQGYMLGNCAYCHSPNGFPSVQNPVLRSLDFFPKRGETGGIFQFPLDKASPRVRVGPTQTESMPYITSVIEPERWGKTLIMESAKLESALVDPCALSDVNCATGTVAFGGIWGSLIWRNVYTPMTYPDADTIFIHMPRNVPGYDCRAHGIMADWMLSIPVDSQGLEVPPDDNRYPRALQVADMKVEQYHSSLTGRNCPGDDDIVDPRVLNSPKDLFKDSLLYPAPKDLGDLKGPDVIPGGFGPDYSAGTGPFTDRVPEHAHWVSADYSFPAGEWTPKRADWHAMLTGQANDDLLSDKNKDNDRLVPVIEELLQVKLSPELEQFALEPVPLGLWSERCSETARARGARQVKDFKWSTRTTMDRWLSQNEVVNPSDANLLLDPERYVHEKSRGQAVFESICMNCHGTEFDSKSPLATTIAELSGGNTLVADFKNGLLGPVEAPGLNAASVFTFSEGNNGATPDEWLARYVLFMGMGGTLAAIPNQAVQLVASTPFYGVVPVSIPSVKDANMLEPAAFKCRELLSEAKSGVRIEVRSNALTGQLAVVTNANDQTFVSRSGQVQLWESLCNFGQRPLVRVMTFEESVFLTQGLVAVEGSTSTSTFRSWDRSGNSVYPETALVGDQLGRITAGIDETNVLPWCVAEYDPKKLPKLVEWFSRVGLSEEQIPFCPAELLAKVDGKSLYMFTQDPASAVGTYEDVTERDGWYRHGGYNAGLAALYYLRKRALDPEFQPVPAYDSADCDPDASAGSESYRAARPAP